MKIFLFIVLGLLIAVSASAAEFDLPDGNPITFESVADFIQNVYNFLIYVSVMLVVGTIVVSGLMWASAGDSGRVDKAKAIFKGGIIGALIILGSGMIIRTVDYFIQTSGDPSAEFNTRRQEPEETPIRAGTLPAGARCVVSAQCRSLNCQEIPGEDDFGVCQ
jgi:hypothetical protein